MDLWYPFMPEILRTRFCISLFYPPQLWTDYYLPLLVFKGCDGTHSLLVNPNTKVGKIYLQPTDGR